MEPTLRIRLRLRLRLRQRHNPLHISFHIALKLPSPPYHALITTPQKSYTHSIQHGHITPYHQWKANDSASIVSISN